MKRCSTSAKRGKRMQHPDEGIIHAWLDGALSAEESTALDAHVASCPECSAAVAEARGLIAASSRIVSALDIVPGGVIPARKPVARPWYTSTQLRAAAAVLFIAGTSFVLFRSREGETLSTVSQRVMADQPAPAMAESDAAIPSPAEPPAAAGAVATAPARKAEIARAKTTERARTDAVADAAVANTEAAQSAAEAALPPAPAPAPATMAAPAPAVAVSSDTAALSRRSVLASPVVVTGAAAGELTSDLRILAVDSSASTRVTLYRIASGAEVTLVEREPISAKAAESRERRFDAVQTSAPEMRVSAQAESGLPVQSISWTDPRTRREYVLSGRVSKETLEEVKKKLLEKP
jgi:hypothetical protein